MSLINQMLRDLDQRQTNAGNETGTVHAVQPKRVPVGAVVLLTVITCGVVAAGGWWIFGMGAGGEEFAANVAAPTKEPTLQAASSFRRKPESSSDKVEYRFLGGEEKNVVTSESPVGAASHAANQAEIIVLNAATDKMDYENRPGFRPSGQHAAVLNPLPADLVPLRGNGDSGTETDSKLVGATVPVANSASPRAESAPQPRTPDPEPRSTPIKQPAVRTPDILYREGRAALAQGNSTLAVERFIQALDKAPARHEIRLSLMDSLLQTGQSATAVSVLNAGLQIAPTHLPFIMLHAKVLLRQGDAQAALAALDAAPTTVVNNLRNNAEFHTLRAALLQRTEQYTAAAQLYKQLLEQNPQNSTWWSGLAISLDQSGHYPEALVAYRRALAGGSLAPSLANYARQRVRALE